MFVNWKQLLAGVRGPGAGRDRQRVRGLQRVRVRVRPDRQREDFHHDGIAGTMTLMFTQQVVKGAGQMTSERAIPLAPSD